MTKMKPWKDRLLYVCSVSGYILGLVGWNTGFHGYFVLLFVPVVWFVLPNRRIVFLFIFFYYLGATKELLLGTYQFFDGNLAQALFLWIMQQAILTTGWLIFWKKNVQGFPSITLRLLATYFITTFIPPYSFIGLAHPITCAGYYFPGTQFLGIALLVLLTSSVSTIVVSHKYGSAQKAHTNIKVLFIVLVISCFICNLTYKKKVMFADWVGVNTALGKYPQDYFKIYQRHLELKKLAEEQINKGKKVIIFPETIAGKWTKIEKHLWNDIDLYAKEKGAVILLGIQQVVSKTRYDNALVVLGDKSHTSNEIIKARMPMPIGNWRPFTKWSATLNFNEGNTILNDKPTAVLICFEEMLVWPILQSMASHNPEVIMTTSNIWWAKGTKIADIMDQTTLMWGRLFGVVVLGAINR